MRRFSLGLAAAALPVFALTLILAGCDKGEKKDTSSGGKGSGEIIQDKPKEAATLLEPKGGILKGKITMKSRPDLVALTSKLQEQIKEKKNDADYCMSGAESEKTEQEYRIGDNNQLGNVFVWIKPESDSSFYIDPASSLLKALPKEIETKQPHCAFIPHCLFHFSQYHPNPLKPKELKPTGQVWKILNDATIGHNTDYKGGSLNSGQNLIIGPKESKTVDNLKPESTPVMIKCSIHPWMDAYMMVVDTPYYAVSFSDTLDNANKKDKSDPMFGTYKIENLPAGKVRVLVWHEKIGWLNEGKGKGEVVEIAANKETTKDFEANPK